MAQTLNYTGTIRVVRCWCGIHFGIPSSLWAESQRTGHSVYCPVGHTVYWGETETDQLREELRQAKVREGQAQTRERAVRDQLHSAERSKSALKGVVTRTKRRIGKGVCPCCNRHFANVERHMTSQHPDYTEATDAGT
jgi:hypothetical protein